MLLSEEPRMASLLSGLLQAARTHESAAETLIAVEHAVEKADTAPINDDATLLIVRLTERTK